MMEFLFPGKNQAITKSAHTGFKPIRSKPSKKFVESEEEKPKKKPEDFAKEIMDLEIDCEANNVSIETVRKLMGLYTQAIDYYVAEQSDKFQYFKKKMANLMLQPQVIEAMEVEHIRRKTFDLKDNNLLKFAQTERAPVKFDRNALAFSNSMMAQPNVKKVDSEMRRQQFELAKNLSSINQVDRLREIVKHHEITSTKNNVMVQTNLKQQLEALSSKLQQRKVAAQTGSTVSGFTKELPKEGFEVSERSDSREKAIYRFENEPELRFNRGMQRCGSHKVMTTTNKEIVNLFLKK